MTDAEMNIVMAAARPLAVQERDAFLQEVAEALAALPERGDGIVHRVMAEKRQNRHINSKTEQAFRWNMRSDWALTFYMADTHVAPLYLVPCRRRR